MATWKKILIGAAALFAVLVVIGLFIPEEDEVGGAVAEIAQEVNEEISDPTPIPTAEPAPEPTATPVPEPTATPEPTVDPSEIEQAVWATRMQTITEDIAVRSGRIAEVAGRGDLAALMGACLSASTEVDWEGAQELAGTTPDVFPPTLAIAISSSFTNWEEAFFLCSIGDLEGAVPLIEQATADTNRATEIINENL